MPKVLVILGATATGKSGLAIKLAKQFNGEIISADSRQVYRKLDIGTGKVTKEEMNDISHHLLDVVDPTDDFSVAQYKKLADKAITEIISRGKLPIIAGGTGFYIQSVVDNTTPPEVVPDEKLRVELKQKTPEELFKILEELDAERAKTIEKKNPRRLIRAIEIAKHIGSVPKVESQPRYECLQIGLELPKEELSSRIRKRVQERLNAGWIDEVQTLQKSGVRKEKLVEFGLGYKIIAEYADTTDTKGLKEKIAASERQYARQQKKWFRRDNRIKWFNPQDKKEIIKIIENFSNS